MKERILKTGIAEYREVEWSGVNESGYVPIGDKLLVLPDYVADKTAGGVSLPETVVERQEMAAEGGVIVALGDGAFMWNTDKITELLGRKPQVGDRVFMERYAGQLLTGLDGKKYRVMEDRCIGAIRITKEKSNAG